MRNQKDAYTSLMVTSILAKSGIFRTTASGANFVNTRKVKDSAGRDAVQADAPGAKNE